MSCLYNQKLPHVQQSVQCCVVSEFVQMNNHGETGVNSWEEVDV